MLEDLADRREDEELLRSLGRAMLIGYEQDRDLHRMLLYAWLDQDEAANRRMWEQIRESPLFAFLEGYIARRQAEGTFRSGDPALLSGALLALPVQLCGADEALRHRYGRTRRGSGRAVCAVPAERAARRLGR